MHVIIHSTEHHKTFMKYKLTFKKYKININVKEISIIRKKKKFI